MKISFWSPVHGQSGTTSNILIISLLAGMLYKKSGILTQTQFNYNNLEAPLVGSNSKNTASYAFFQDVGLDALIRYFKASRLTREIIENCCISLKNTNVSLLPGTSKNNRDYFDYEMETVLLNLIRSMEDWRDLIYIDVNSGSNLLSWKIIADSDLTVVNLSQNLSVVDHYFECFRDQIHSKIFYLFGNYDCNSKYNINNIRRRYHKEITIFNSGVIPYSTTYLDAQCDGKVIDFIRNNLLCGKDDENHYLMLKARGAARKILMMAGLEISVEERMESNGLFAK